MHGGGASLQIARVALQRLAPGGRLILYTGAAIVGGSNPLYAALRTLAAEHGCAMRAREIDPDVFGEELDKPGYIDVERIAVMAVVISRP